MKTHTLDEVQDKLIGKIGTPNRDRFENDLRMDLIGQVKTQTNQERKMTQKFLNGLTSK